MKLTFKTTENTQCHLIRNLAKFHTSLCVHISNSIEDKPSLFIIINLGIKDEKNVNYYKKKL